MRKYLLALVALVTAAPLAFAGLTLDDPGGSPTTPTSTPVFLVGCGQYGGANQKFYAGSAVAAAGACVATMKANDTQDCGPILGVIPYRVYTRTIGDSQDMGSYVNVTVTSSQTEKNCGGESGPAITNNFVISAFKEVLTCPGDPNCPAQCKVNTEVSSGYFSVGTTSAASPLLLGCKNGCQVTFDGVSPAGSTVEAGKKTWYAKGSYINTGQACTDVRPDKEVGQGKAGLPKDTCGANQTPGMVNNQFVCVTNIGSDGSSGGDQNEETKDKSSSETERKTVTNPDGSTTEIETTTKIDSAGNKTVTEKTTTKYPDGRQVQKETTTGSPNKPPGTPASGPDAEETPCQKNPASEGCGGNPGPVSGLYTAKSKTVGGVIDANVAAMRASPAGAAVAGFFTVSAGGGCPTWAGAIPFINTTVTFDQLCTPAAAGALAILRICLLVTASFMAFRVALE